MCSEKGVMVKGEDVEKRFSVDIAAHHSFHYFSAFLFLFGVPCIGDAKRRHLYIYKARLTLKWGFLSNFEG